MYILAIALLALLVACPAPAAAPPPTRDSPPVAQPEPIRHTKVIGALGGIVSAGWAPDWSGFAGTSRGRMCSYGAGRFALEMPLEEGDRMLTLEVSAAGTGSADLDIVSVSVAPDGALTLGTVGSLTQPNVPAGPVALPIDLVDTLVEGGVSHWFEFGADQAGLCVGPVWLTYDRP